jgi:hypothetical protein
MGELARALTDQLEASARDALRVLGEEMLAGVRRDLGHPPVRDPDRGFNLNEEASLRVWERSVTVLVPGPYAQRLHDDVGMHRPSGSKLHYLSRNAQAVAAKMPGVLAASVREGFEGGAIVGKARRL